MLAMAFNGSPRADGSTAALLRAALEGAASEGAKTEFINLSRLRMRGCQGCFACKLRGGKSFGKCVLKDDFTPVYGRLEEADAIFLGSPIYFGSVTSEAKALIDRLFPYLTYGDPPSRFPKKARVGLIYTMGIDSGNIGWVEPHIANNERVMSRLIGQAESLLSLDTMHVDDYTAIIADNLQPFAPRKKRHREEQFPKDLDKARRMGARFIAEAKR